MRIIAQCPLCSSSWLLDDTNQDRRIRCRKCSRVFRVPALDEVPKAAALIRRARNDVYVDQSGKTFG
ncbi:MAG: hypothetical protein P8016_03605 [Sedimentisphaerales bacterium]